MYLMILLGSTFLCAGFVPSAASKMCQLEDNCRVVESSFSSSTVCRQPEVLSILPPQFTAEPSNQIVSQTDTTITFQCAIANVSNYLVKFVWKFNGREINTSSQDFRVSSDKFSSRLKVQVSNSAVGAYQCIVYSEELKYNVTSRYGCLKIPNCSGGGWMDPLLPSVSAHNNTVELSIPKGSTTILECMPNITLLSSYTTWLINNNATLDSDHIKLPNGALLVRNFDLSFNTKVTFRCVVVSNSCPQLTREFNLRSTGEEPSSMVSSNQTAILGSLVSLYCITNGKTSIAWYKDGQPLGSKFNWTTFGHMNEVLVIHDISIETNGQYSCVDDDNIIMTMQLDVLTPPSLASIQVEDHTANNQLLVLPPTSVQSLILSCTTGTHHSEMSYTWFFRGNPITASMDVVVTQRDSVLFVTGGDVYGSYQCVAANKGGSAAAMLFVVEDKPNPPSSITMVRDSDRDVNRPTASYLYSIVINPPLNQLGHEGLYAYTVEAYIYRSPDLQYNVCTCNYTSQNDVEVNFSANEFAGFAKKNFYIRAAVESSTGGLSDFQPYYSDSTCGSVIDIVAPPPPTMLMNVPTLTEGGWNELFTWTTPLNDNYPSRLYETQLALQCEGLENLNEVVSSSASQYELPIVLPCCTICDFTVNLRTTLDSKFSSSAVKNFTTSSIRPTQPPVINSVERNFSNGQSINIDMTLPPINVSCGASHYSVHYSDQQTTSRSLDECQLVVGPDTHSAGRYLCPIEVDTQFCWQSLNFSVEFGNDLGWSEKSRPTSLPGVNKDLVRQHSAITVIGVSESTLTVSLQMSNGLDCLLTKDSFTANVCISSSDSASCGLISGPTHTYTFTNLNWSTRYFIQGRLSILDIQNITLQSLEETTNVGVPNVSPRNLTITVDASGKLLLSWLKPDMEKLRGIVTRYNVYIVDSIGNEMKFNVTNPSLSVDAPSEGVKYESASVSACTSAGCGPTVSQNVPTDKLGSSFWQINVVKVAIGFCVGIVVILMLIVVCVVCCVCAVKKWRRRKNYEQSNRGLLYNSREHLTDGDLISIGEPDGAPSVHSDRTELDQLPKLSIHRKVADYLKDVDSDLQDMESGHYIDSHKSNQPSVTASSQRSVIMSSPHKLRNKEDDTQSLIENEQRNERFIASHDARGLHVNERLSRFGQEYMQSSPIDAVANLAHNHTTSDREDIISMHSLTGHTKENRTEKISVPSALHFIGDETPLISNKLSEMPLRRYNFDTKINSSGNIQNSPLLLNDHSSDTSPTKSFNHRESFRESQTGNYEYVEEPLSDSGSYVDSNTTLPSNLQLSTNEIKCKLSISPQTSEESVPDDLSQDTCSSVFDESIKFNTYATFANQSDSRSAKSSGVYSTSSIGNGYVSEDLDYSSCRYRSSSEGYISARTTPAPTNKNEFTYSALNEGDSQAKGSMKPNTTYISNPSQCSRAKLSQQPIDPSGYLNTEDLILDTISMTMDQETKDGACKQF